MGCHESKCHKSTATKAVLRGKCIAIQAFLKKEERSQINNLIHHLNELQKEQQQQQQKKKTLKSEEGSKS